MPAQPYDSKKTGAAIEKGLIDALKAAGVFGKPKKYSFAEIQREREEAERRAEFMSVGTYIFKIKALV